MNGSLVTSPACAVPSSTITVMFTIRAAANNWVTYGVGFSSDSTPWADPTDTWVAGGTGGICPQNAVQFAQGASATTWHAVTITVTVPAGFAGGYLIVMAEENGFNWSSGACSYHDIETLAISTTCSPPTATATPTRTSTRTATPTPTPALPLTKSSNVGTIALGSTLTFCIAWSNDSSGAITRTFYDQLAAQFTWVGGDAGCSAAGQLVTCSFAAAAYSSGSKCFWARVSSTP